MEYNYKKSVITYEINDESVLLELYRNYYINSLYIKCQRVLNKYGLVIKSNKILSKWIMSQLSMRNKLKDSLIPTLKS